MSFVPTNCQDWQCPGCVKITVETLIKAKAGRAGVSGVADDAAEASSMVADVAQWLQTPYLVSNGLKPSFLPP